MQNLKCLLNDFEAIFLKIKMNAQFANEQLEMLNRDGISAREKTSYWSE